VARPRYQRARLLGEQPVHGLAKRYLEELSQTLRPGTYKVHSLCAGASKLSCRQEAKDRRA
jgi:hypothetical protein